jgi:hypothetical protein
MTDTNHRRENRKPVNERHKAHEYNNGTAPTDGKAVSSRAIGKTDYLDKSMSSWSAAAPLSGEYIGAGIGNDFVNGHRGMATAVRGAKKFVRTRVRFHENSATKRLANEVDFARDDQA